MKRFFLISLSLIVLVCVISTMTYAQGVLTSGQRSAEQVVSVRKFVMRVLASNAGDIGAKINTGAIKEIVTPAKSIAALATFLPLVYDKTHSEVYPVTGSKYFFKKAMPAQIETASENLRVQAEKLAKLAEANDKSAVKAQVGNLFGSCGACHGQFRGEY